MKAGDLVDGRFRVERETAHGGMGTIFRALDTLSDRVVAIKVMRRTEAVLDAVVSGRFAREIDLLASLDDPRIVRYISHGTTEDSRPFLVEEWVDGASLSELLDTDGFTTGESATLVAEIAAGLAIAHAAGIVHRDVKPPNILLADGDFRRIKIIDFGIARLAEDPFVLTRTGTFVGTPGYIAPEQARGESIDARCDVFALGCILYECLTGRPAFAGRSLTAIRAKVLIYTPPSPVHLGHDLPVELITVLDCMLSKHPEMRPRDGAEVAAALAPFVGLRGDARRVTPYLPPRTEPFPVGALTLPSQDGTSDTRSGGVVACLVIADGGPGPVDLVALRRVLAPHDGRVDMLLGGTLLVTPAPTLLPSEQVVRAAGAALALRRLLSGSIVLCAASTAGPEAVSDAIDQGTSTLASESARPDPADRRIRLDRAFAAQLRDQGFAIELDGDAAFLVA